MQTDLVAIVLNYLGYGVGIVAIGAAVIVVIAALARAVFLPGDVRRQACCGGCGHPVGATPGAACPECGGAFGKVGIITPGMALRWRGGLGLAVLAWSVLCTLAGAPFFEVARRMQGAGPQIQILNSRSASTYLPSDWDAVDNNLPDAERRIAAAAVEQVLDFRIETSGDKIAGASDRGIYSRSIVLRLRRNGAPGPAALEVNPLDRTYTLRDVGGAVIKTGDKIDDALIRAWFVAGGMDVESPLVATTMRDALLLATVSRDDPDAIDQGGALFTNPMPDPGGLRFAGGGPVASFWLTQPQAAALLRDMGIGGIDWRSVFGVSLLAVPATIWLAGVIWMVRRRRRILAG